MQTFSENPYVFFDKSRRLEQEVANLELKNLESQNLNPVIQKYFLVYPKVYFPFFHSFFENFRSADYAILSRIFTRQIQFYIYFQYDKIWLL